MKQWSTTSYYRLLEVYNIYLTMSRIVSPKKKKKKRVEFIFSKKESRIYIFFSKFLYYLLFWNIDQYLMHFT